MARLGRWSAAVVAMTAGLVWSQDARFEDVLKSMLGTMDQITKTLSGITDEDTAKAARPELKKSAEEWQAVRKKAEHLPPPSKEEKDRLAKEYKKKLEDSQKKLFEEISRVQGVPGGKAALLEVSKVLGKQPKK